MTKYYLVRRSLESYLGPMTLSELKQSYKRMEFGLQDEVAAHCGSWISLDNLPKLKKKYPELAQVVQEELLGGWGVSNHSQKRVLEATRSLRPRRSGRTKGLLILGATVVVAAALIILKDSKLSQKFFDDGNFPAPESVHQYIASGDEEGFSEAMGRIKKRLLPKVAKSRKSYNDWIPYLRYYAFLGEGEIVGLKPKLLRGMGQFAAPSNCSMKSWTERWKSSEAQWRSLIDGKMVPTEEWARLLTWDFRWIRRRNKVIGWIFPTNFYQGCLIMAKKSLENLNSTADGALEIKKRLQTISQGVSREKIVLDQSVNNVFSYMSCLEIGKTQDDLALCKLPLNLSDEWQNYLALCRARAETALVLKTTGVLTDAELQLLSKLYRSLKPKDPFSHFNYQPEIKYLVSIMLNNGSLKEASKRIRYEFPEVDFSH